MSGRLDEKRELRERVEAKHRSSEERIRELRGDAGGDPRERDEQRRRGGRDVLEARRRRDREDVADTASRGPVSRSQGE